MKQTEEMLRRLFGQMAEHSQSDRHLNGDMTPQAAVEALTLRDQKRKTL